MVDGVTSGALGAVVSGVAALLPAFALAGVLSLPAGSFACAVTSEPSFTLSCGIVVLSLPASTLGTVSGLSEVQLPSGCLVKVTFSGVSEPSGVTVTSTVSPTSASLGTFTFTEPSVVDGVTSGALGAVVSGVAALLPAFALAGVLSLPAGSFACAVTSEPSFTLSCGIVVLFLPASTLGTVSGLSEVQLPSGCLVKVTFSGVSEPSGVTVTSTVSPTSASLGTFTFTEPSVVDGVTSGALGAVVSGVAALLPAFALAGVLSLPAGSFACAVTSEPSFTLSCGIVVLSLPASTLGTVSGLSEVQLPSGCLVKVTFSGVSEPSGVTVTSTVSPTSASLGTFTFTEPSVVDGVTSGALGAVVSGVAALLPAFTVPSSPVLPAVSVAFAFTGEPSCTLSAGMVALPLTGSTATSGLFEVQLPSLPLVKVAVFGVPASSV